MPTITAYLAFDGNCSEAMRFYEKALGGKLEMVLTYGESPMAGDIPAAHHGRVMHAALSLPGGGQLFGGDKMPGMDQCGGSPAGGGGVGLALALDTVAAGEAAFAALADGGKVTMPMAPSFWVESFGMVTDRYGYGWLVNAGAPRM
jgi:PhnB protein